MPNRALVYIPVFSVIFGTFCFQFIFAARNLVFQSLSTFCQMLFPLLFLILSLSLILSLPPSPPLRLPLLFLYVYFFILIPSYSPLPLSPPYFSFLHFQFPLIKLKCICYVSGSVVFLPSFSARKNDQDKVEREKRREKIERASKQASRIQ